MDESSIGARIKKVSPGRLPGLTKAEMKTLAVVAGLTLLAAASWSVQRLFGWIQTF
ncbi:MAG: hypothetical protein JJU20_05000 [Opitutales bacterium]|nr:hypothetical protein [Opitutales bacterium]